MRYSQLGGIHWDVVGYRLQFASRTVDHGSLTGALVRASLVDHTISRILRPQLFGP